MTEFPEVGEPIPGADVAQADPRKFTDYALSPEAPRGRDKAAVFRSALGFERDQWELLRDRILAELPLRPVSRCKGGEYPTYEVCVLVQGVDARQAWVVTGWEMREGVPHLVTLRVATAARQKTLQAKHPSA
jgi:hypothetical protein